MNIKTPNPPRYLGKTGKKFWGKTLCEFELSEPHDLERLAQACHCLDRITEAREKINIDGCYIKDRFGQLKEHPGQKVERNNKILFARLIRELCLDIEEPQESRPPRQY